MGEYGFVVKEGRPTAMTDWVYSSKIGIDLILFDADLRLGYTHSNTIHQLSKLKF
jgi:hypothetical protein